VRKKSPSETLGPLISQLDSVIESVSPLADSRNSLEIIEAILNLITGSLAWVSVNTAENDLTECKVRKPHSSHILIDVHVKNSLYY